MRRGLSCSSIGVLFSVILSGCFGFGSADNVVVSPVSGSNNSPAPSAATVFVEGFNSNEVTLAWYSAGGTEYDLRHSTAALTKDNFPSATRASALGLPATAGVREQFTISGLSPGEVLFFALKAGNSGSWSDLSNVASMTTGIGAVGSIGFGHTGWVKRSIWRMIPSGLAYANGYLYVADSLSERVLRFDSSGKFAGWLGGVDGWQMGGLPGKPSNGDRKLNYTNDIAIDPATQVLYVCDSYNYRVQKWTLDGVYQGWIGGGVNGWQTGNAPASGTGDAQFLQPKSVAVDSVGNIFVVDMYGSRVLKWSRQGTFLGWFGKGTTMGWHAPGSGDTAASGSADGQFNYPYDIAIDGSDNVFVMDWYNHRIQKWTTAGVFVAWYGKGNLTTGWHSSGSGETPSAGTAEQQLSYPYGVTSDSSGNIYVSDNDSRIQKWSAAGTYLGWYGKGNLTTGWHAAGSGETSSMGIGDGELQSPMSVLWAAGSLFVADYTNQRVMKWTDQTYQGFMGGDLDTWQMGNGLGSGAGKHFFNRPLGLVLDAQENLYIADRFNHRVQKFTASGNYVGSIGGGLSGWQQGDGYTDVSATGDGKFNRPNGVAVDSAGNIYVVDSANSRLQKWSAAGVFLGWYGKGTSTTGWHAAGSGETGVAGTGDAELSGPTDVAIDAGGNILVSDSNRIQKWSADHTYLGWFGKGNLTSGWHAAGSGQTQSAGTLNAELNRPCSVGADSSSNVYALDSVNHRVLKFSSDGTYLGWIGGGVSGWQMGAAPSSGAGDAQFKFDTTTNCYCRLSVDRTNNLLYIVDYANHRVQKWTTAGQYVGWVGRGDPGWQTGSMPVTGYYGADSALYYPAGVAGSPSGSLYISESWGHRVVKFK